LTKPSTLKRSPTRHKSSLSRKECKSFAISPIESKITPSTLMTKKKASPSLVALVGTDPALLRDHIQEIKNNAGDSEDFDIAELEGAEVTTRALLASLQTPPLFSSKRLIIVRRADQLPTSEMNALTQALEQEKIPEFTTLVFTFEGEEKSRGTALLNLITRRGKVIPLEAKREDFFRLLRKRASSAGVQFEAEALERLAELTWYDFSLATGEMEKLLALTPPGGVITKSSVEKTILPSPEWKVFDLLDALCGGRTAQALEKLQNFARSVAKPQEEAIRSLLPLLHRQLSLLWQCRAESHSRGSSGLSPGDIFPRRPNWPEISKKSDFQRKKIEALARNLPLSALSSLFQILADTDKKLKGVLPSVGPLEALEEMVLQMSECVRQALAPDTTRRV
jgi:DNA polymerase III delta subunit